MKATGDELRTWHVSINHVTTGVDVTAFDEEEAVEEARELFRLLVDEDLRRDNLSVEVKS